MFTTFQNTFVFIINQFIMITMIVLTLLMVLITLLFTLKKHFILQKACLWADRYYVTAIVMLLSLFSISCSQEDKDDFDDSGSSSISKSDVVGSFYYDGYSGPLYRELEIDFFSDNTGMATEYSYGSRNNILSVHKYVFTWKIKGSKVLLSGTSASADSDGDVGASISWSGEFEFTHGVLVPGKSFIEGYANKVFKDLKQKDISKYVSAELEYDPDNSLITVTINTNYTLNYNWSGQIIKYGYVEYPTPNYKWIRTGGTSNSFTFYDSSVDIWMSSIKALYEKEKNGNYLDSEERGLRTDLINTVNNYIKKFKSGNVWKSAIKIDDDIFELSSSYSVLDSKYLSSSSNSNNNNNNNNDNDNDNDNDNNNNTDTDTDTDTEGTHNGYEYVDLGLSVKWATFNVGANSPEKYGDYYAWGETVTKTNYLWTNYKFRTKGDSYYNVKFSKYILKVGNGTVDNKKTLEPEDDVAHVKWGGRWRMPTKAEWDELHSDKCTWTWITNFDPDFNYVRGYKVTSNKPGYTDRFIFLPAAGMYDEMTLKDVGMYGYYWSSSLHTDYSYRASIFEVTTGMYSTSTERYRGLSVRPVCP